MIDFITDIETPKNEFITDTETPTDKTHQEVTYEQYKIILKHELLMGDGSKIAIDFPVQACYTMAYNINNEGIHSFNLIFKKLCDMLKEQFLKENYYE